MSTKTIVNCYKNAGWVNSLTDTISLKQLLMKPSEKSSTTQTNADLPREEVTSEERKAVAELQQVLSSSDSGPGTTQSSLPLDDIQIELEVENAQSFEDYSVEGNEMHKKICL